MQKRNSVLLKIAALLMAALTVFSMAACSLTGSSEEETTTERPAELLEERPQTADAIVDFYNRAANTVKAARPGLRIEYEYDVKDIDTGNVPEAEALVRFAKSFAEALDGSEETLEYGTDLNDVLPIRGTDVVSRLAAGDVAEAQLNDVEDDLYAYDLYLKLQDSAAAGVWDLNVNKSDVLNAFFDYKDTLEVSDYEVAYANAEISANIGNETNEMRSMTIARDALVTATVNFCGTLESLGEVTVQFTLREELKLRDFIWNDPATETVTAA